MLPVFKEDWQKVALNVSKSAIDQVKSGHGLDGFVRKEVDREFIQGDQTGKQVKSHAKPKESLSGFGFGCVVGLVWHKLILMDYWFWMVLQPPAMAYHAAGTRSAGQRAN